MYSHMSLSPTVLLTVTNVANVNDSLDWHCFYGDNAGNNDTRQSLLTCLGHLERHDINRNDPISVVLPKVARGSK